MKLAKIKSDIKGNQLVIGHHNRWFPLGDFSGYENVTRLSDIVADQQLRELTKLVESHGSELDMTDFSPEQVATIADRDANIWGAGLNYQRHSDDLGSEQPDSGPGSYLRPASCLIDNGQYIELPSQSGRVTAEAELGLVIGAVCKNVRRERWRSVIAGITAVLDMTAEDVIRENPRYIPWAKGFDTFCSIGPVLVTLDEFDEKSLDSLCIATVQNGETIASAAPSEMKYDLGYLVEYFTAGRTLEPGTVICTGTPGAAVISPGDSINSVVEQVGTLTHAVR
ncbi:2-keto-4-pentenoate hydratase/2-oxohepta-3-ene-1,7-dioic acid hydratase (catechol pathway) [Actinopolyspora xinjiangensis]|uniref:2-keto-4-pentenoate hydratase/2-oxohepta-3-ene-1,7-dioic acid hydratase (Catechol pathway) n=1 Tax=Actinopolyspora xinjiangensis TaxID=405564 RepID=A0A1H0WZ18_9ACTN|nr:fumarylacetoacetate hydrolase family protein [Actinopolyspora xinjiangensis]SDP95695.1 2-keto-4-pentenoate hydratase/2-oxohepta-3-ene-1,7-dioic acid hydratase (catechol pathway) [Actinopolyspora xinjiangensis]